MATTEERVVPSAPSAMHLYIEGDSTEPVYHQMCYMRPPASELCGRVPMLLEPPEVSARSCGLRPAVLPPEVVLIGMPESSDDEAAPDGGADAPADRERCEAAVAAAERAARRGARLPPHVRAMRAEEWALAFEGASVPFGALTADQLLALADEVGSAALADLLLDRALGRLLCDGAAAAAAEGAAAPWPDSARADAEPLPPPLARLLVHLLHQGSALRLAPAAFDETIVARLRAHAPLGPRAAFQAQLVFSAAARNGMR